MSHPEIIIPFGLPPADHAKDLTHLLASACGPDGLALLVSRRRSSERIRFDDFAQSLPHEQWLSKRHQATPLQLHARHLGISLAPGFWFLLNPVHLHVASTHLVLTDYRQLNVTDEESRQLFDRAQRLCSDLNRTLVYGDASHWFLRADDWSGFTTASPDAACGHNIEIWSPRGEAVLGWRKLQNEIQMDWFIHPVQEQRQQRGERAVNGLWMSSGTRISSDDVQPVGASTWHNGISSGLAPPDTALRQLRSAALANDWGTWANIMIELDRSYFTTLVQALKKRQVRELDLYLSNSNSLLHLKISSNSLHQFWRRANLALLR